MIPTGIVKSAKSIIVSTDIPSDFALYEQYITARIIPVTIRRAYQRIPPFGPKGIATGFIENSPMPSPGKEITVIVPPCSLSAKLPRELFFLC